MSAYVSLECPKHGWSDVDTSSVGCPACEIDHIQRERTLAQIAALEWAQGQLHMGLAINAEIERLRKELEG